MRMSFKLIFTNIISGFASFHGFYLNQALASTAPSEHDSPQLQFHQSSRSDFTIFVASDLQLPYPPNTQDLVKSTPIVDLKHATSSRQNQSSSAQDLVESTESRPNQDNLYQRNLSQEVPPSPVVDLGNLEKPAQVPARLDDLISSPDLLKNPTKPEEVQIQRVEPITLQQAIELVQRNNRQLQAAKVQLARDRAVMREAQAAWFPTLGLQSSYSRDLSASGELSVDNSRVQANSQIPQLQAQLNQLLSQPVSINPVQQLLQGLSFQQTQSQLASIQGSLQNLDNFATRSFNGTFAVNYSIFTGGQRPALIQAASEQVRISELEVERVNEQIRLDVTQAYYDLQQADQQILIQSAAVREASKSLSNAQALLGSGLATRLDVLNAQVQLDNSTQELTQINSQRDTAIRRLAQLLSLPPDTSVSAVDPIDITERWNLTLGESIVRAFKYRVELEQQLAQRRASQQQRKAAISNFLPKLSAFANFNLLNLNTDQPGDFIAKGFATGYSFGFSLQWSFFDGGVTLARIAQQDANIKLAEIQFAQSSEQVRFEVERAYFSLQSNLKNVQVARDSLDRAQEALRIARLRFQAGVGTQLDVLNAETNLTRAQGNLLNAILGYNRALAALRRAVGAPTQV